MTNLYVCATPYHIFVSLLHLIDSNEKGCFYLTSHDKRGFENIEKIGMRLEGNSLSDQVITKKRNINFERFFIEKLKELNERKGLRDILDKCRNQVFIFSWNPYSIYSIARPFIKLSNEINLVEDGAMLYEYPKPSNLKLSIKKYMYGIETDLTKNNINQILVQFPKKYPESIKDKLSELNLKKWIAELDEEQKNVILSAFLSKHEIAKLADLNGDYIIILTQPLSEDGLMSEEKKLEIYKQIVEKYSDKFNIIIKKHPREETNYDLDNTLVLEGYFPSELFPVIGVEFKKAIGFCTSAVHNIDAEECFNTNEEFFRR